MYIGYLSIIIKFPFIKNLISFSISINPFLKIHVVGIKKKTKKIQSNEVTYITAFRV